MPKNKALLLIDLQNDFCVNGALAVPNGEAVISIANEMMQQFDTVIASQDWHPKNHASFQTLWPVHCVQDSEGADLHPDLHVEKITKVIQKGLDPVIDSYSAFYDNDHVSSTGLTDYLRQKNIHTLVVMGLATEYCIKFSCLDAVCDGFLVELYLPGCRGLQKPDIESALKEMQDAGVIIREAL